MDAGSRAGRHSVCVSSCSLLFHLWHRTLSGLSWSVSVFEIWKVRGHSNGSRGSEQNRCPFCREQPSCSESFSLLRNGTYCSKSMKVKTCRPCGAIRLYFRNPVTFPLFVERLQAPNVRSSVEPVLFLEKLRHRVNVIA